MNLKSEQRVLVSEDENGNAVGISGTAIDKHAYCDAWLIQLDVPHRDSDALGLLWAWPYDCLELP